MQYQKQLPRRGIEPRTPTSDKDGGARKRYEQESDTTSLLIIIIIRTESNIDLVSVIIMSTKPRNKEKRNILLFFVLSFFVFVTWMRSESMMETFLRPEVNDDNGFSNTMNPMLSDHLSIWRATAVWFVSRVSQIQKRTVYFPTTTSTGIQVQKYDPHWLIVSPKLNLAVTFIPKNMCSAIKKAMNTIECHGVPNPNCAEARKNRYWREHLLLLNSMTRVLWIRDPFERALSAYQNSQRNLNIFTPTCPSLVNCTFAEWVDDLYHHQMSSWRKIPGNKRSGNEHFYSQVGIAQLDHVHYHYILRLSSPIDQDFFWKVLLRGAVEPQILNPSNHNTTEDAKLHAQRTYDTLSTQTLEKLYNLYRDDFDLWDTLLHRGTRRIPGETTLYDIFKADPRSKKWRRKHNEDE